MTDEEQKTRTDLFGENAAKPLFGTDDSLPQGKPLFDSEYSESAETGFAKPLFEAPQEEERTCLDDFQEFDNFADAAESVPEELTDTEPQSEVFVEQEENSCSGDIDPFAGNEEPVAEPVVPVPGETSANDSLFVQEKDPEPAFTIPKTTVVLNGDLDGMSLGALMALARETAGYSPEDVYNGTKINERYLLAIESDQFDKLPSGAFPGAYVRALCSFYHLESSAQDIAQKKAMAYCTACRPPDEVYDQLPAHAIINKEEQEKFRRIVMVSGIVLFTIIVFIITVIIISSAKKDNVPSVPAVSPVTMEQLEKIDPASPRGITTELDVPR